MIVSIDITVPVAVPEGTVVVSADPLTVDLADYDYAPFQDPGAWAFDFTADVLHPDGRIDRAATCTSHPGRHTTIKEN